MDNNSTTTIGKDVIESLTSGMYEDSRFIFREYIQNAADQIDNAERVGILHAGQGDIYISIESDRGVISIEDNATGIESEYVGTLLKNIAQSSKKRGVNKGFRGIGRLGGLAYCSTLIFETSVQGEALKSKMIWDANLLRTIINDREHKEEASTVIDRVTEIETSEESIDSHYFKVTLVGVTNKSLLDVVEVRKYLSMVAPVPFHSKFIYGKKIYDQLKSEGILLDEYKIYINTEQLFKGYTPYIYDGEGENKRKIGEVIDVLFFKEYDTNGNLMYWGWYGITEKNQSLNQINDARGFRLRKANIQVGNEFSLTKLHRDKRFQFYFIGEIHAIHGDLIPNARRDYFSENNACTEFERKLKAFFHTTIHKLCYTASEINSSVKRIEEYNNLQKEFQDRIKQGFTDNKEHLNFKERLIKKKDEAEKAEHKLVKIASNSQDVAMSPISRILDRVTSNKPTKVEHVEIQDFASKPKFRTDNLSRLSKEQRKFLGQIFGIIKNVLPNETAENLILKIEEEIK